MPKTDHVQTGPAKALAAAFRAAAKAHGEGTVAEADAVRAALPTLAECVS